MNWVDFHFLRPTWLLALLPYLGVLVYLLRRKLGRGNWAAVCDAELLPYLLEDKVVHQKRWPMMTAALAGLVSILAMAGPSWERLPVPVFRNDSALVIVLDLSQSMNAADASPSRLTLARYKIADILKHRKDGQTALVVFADEAFVVTPLTNDTQTIASQLSALTTDIMPGEGNNIAKALEQAKALFIQAGLQKGQILLITDGGNSDDGIAKAKSLDSYQLLVLAVGTNEGAPIALSSGGFLKDEEGNIIIAKLDADNLEKLAGAGGGFYQPMTTDDNDIQTILSAVTTPNQGADEQQDDLRLQHWQDRGPWLLILVLPFAALAFRRGLLIVVMALMLLPMPQKSHAFELNTNWQDWWQTKDQQAQAAYKQGDYAKAAELFQNKEWQAAAQYKEGAYDKALQNLKDDNSANGNYNKGNALAQSGQLRQALAAYNQALKLNPNDADTKYNKELVEKALEQQKQEKQQNQQKDNQQNSDNNQDQSKQGEEQAEQKNSNQSGPANPEKSQDEQADKQNGEKPEAKPEQSQESTENQPEQKEPEPQQQAGKTESAKPEQIGQKDPQKESEKPDTAAAAETAEPMTKEEQQAHEQWLKRIPDDPAGLLKRKFKYQYEQRRQQ